MISLPTHCRLLQFKKKKNRNPKKDEGSSSYSATQEKNLDVGFPWVAGNKDEPPSLSSSLSFFSSLIKDNNKLGGSSLFVTFFPSFVENDNELGSRLVIILDCFSSIAKDNDEPFGLSFLFNVFFLSCKRQ